MSTIDYKFKTKQPSASKHDAFYRKVTWNRFTLTLFAIVCIILAIFALSLILRVREVEVRGNEHYSQEEIIRAIGIEKGDNLFFFDKFAATSRVFAKLPYIEQIAVERKLPGSVVINVVECKAMAYISVGEEDWTIDENCKVLGKAAEGEHPDLLPIYGFNPGTLLIGERLTTRYGNDEPVATLADVLDQIRGRSLELHVDSIDASNYKSMQLSYDGKYKVILGTNKNIEYKFGMVLSTVEQLQKGDIGTIDVSDGATCYFTPN